MATVNEKMTAIADAIRDKTGGSEALTLDDMASGVNEVYEAGKQAEYDEFWDSYQNNGNRKKYEFAFAGNGWNPTNFKPKHPIKPTSARMMFYLAENLVGEIEPIIGIDFSECTEFVQAFQNLGVSRLGVLDLRKAEGASGIFTNLHNIETIDKVKVGENLPAGFGLTNSTKLKNLIMEGVMPQNVNAPNAPFTLESLKSIITCLKDFAEDTTNHYKRTVTFKTSAFDVLEAEGETAEYNGTACTWAELIDNKKWNLVKA